jgi:hypothetical protein
MPKAGGPVQDIESLAGLTTSHMGYSVFVDGPNIFTVDTASGSTGRLWRISTDGGATWARQDYANFGGTSPPADTFYSGVVYNGRIYLISDGTSTENSEIWSVDANATTLPAVATLERTFTGWGYCNGVDRDTTYYYMVCGSNDGLIRVPVAGGGDPELIDASVDYNVTRNNVHGEDLDADGVFDVLYVQSYFEEAHYVCSPASSEPYLGPLVNFGTGSSNYGLGFDASANVLWMFDDDTDELITIQ